LFIAQFGFSKDVKFTIEFYEEEGFKDVLMDSLMNYYHPPYQVVLKPKKRKTITIHANINVYCIKNYAEGGESNGVNIIIKSGNLLRKL
jgi:hypothetical protein